MSRSGARYASVGDTIGGPEWRTGQYVGSPFGITRDSPTGWLNGRLSFTRVWVPSVNTGADRIRVSWNAAGAAGALVRLGVYGSLANGLPGALTLDAGTVDGTQATGEYEITIALTIPGGQYWLAGVVQGAPATVPGIFRWLSSTNIEQRTALANSPANGYFSTATTFTGALPDPAPTSLTGPAAPMDIALRAA